MAERVGMTEEQENKALAFLKQGATRKDALLLVGIPLAEHKGLLKGEFLEKVQQTQAAFRMGLVVGMVKTARDGGNTTGALKLLAILDPMSWSDPGVVKRGGEDVEPGGPIGEAIKPASEKNAS